MPEWHLVGGLDWLFGDQGGGSHLPSTRTKASNFQNLQSKPPPKGYTGTGPRPPPPPVPATCAAQRAACAGAPHSPGAPTGAGRPSRMAWGAAAWAKPLVARGLFCGNVEPASLGKHSCSGPTELPPHTPRQGPTGSFLGFLRAVLVF